MSLENYTPLTPFKFWVQKVLPTVYDDSLSYYELLTKVVDYLNTMAEDVSILHNVVEEYTVAFNTLKAFVDNYFDNLDVQQEINSKLDEMALDGSLGVIVSPFLPELVSDWLEEHITPTTPIVDDTLTIDGAAADAGVTGRLLAMCPKYYGEIGWEGETDDDNPIALKDFDDQGWVTLTPLALRHTTDSPVSATDTALLFTYVLDSNVSWQVFVQKNTASLYIRSVNSGTATDWINQKPVNTALNAAGVPADSAAVGNALAGKFPKTVTAGSTLDFNEVAVNTIIRFGSSSTKLNGPPYPLSVGAVLTVGEDTQEITRAQKYQIIWDSSYNNLYFRVSYFDATDFTIHFKDWVKLGRDIQWFPLTDNASGTMDFDTLAGDTMYRFSSSLTKSHQPPGVLAGWVATYGMNSGTVTSNQHFQICFDTVNNRMWYRASHYSNGANPYYEWALVSNNRVTNKIRVTYSSTGANKFTEFVRAVVPTHNGYYVQYNFGHAQAVANNSDVWVMANARLLDGVFSAVKYLTTHGEWDFAVRIGIYQDAENPLRDDFSGGELHGDEKLESITWYIDGKVVPYINLISNVFCDELKCVEKSVVYDPDDGTTPIGDHYVVRVWDKYGYHIDQKFVWSVDQNVYRGYMCMFPASRDEINYYYTDKTLEPNAITVDASINGSDVSWTDMYGNNGMDSRVQVSQKKNIHVSTDDGEDYYKLYYYFVPNNTAVHVGDVWESSTTYKLNYCNSVFPVPTE